MSESTGGAEARADGAARPGTVLWYESPAAEWVEALPVGNGRLGAMVFGGVARERIQFNEDTLWTGKPHEYDHPGAADHLETIRRLLREGKQKEAEDLASEHFMSVPLGQMAYQPFGDLRLDFPGHEEATGYRRSLDLDAAVAKVAYTVGGVTFTREVFASAIDQVIVVRIAADRPGSVSLTARMESPHEEHATRASGPVEVSLAGRVKDAPNKRRSAQECVMRFEARLRAIPEPEARAANCPERELREGGGKVTSTDEGITVEGADAVTLLLAAATNFVDFRDVSGDPASRSEEAMDRAAGKGYEEMKDAHLADHRRLFRRVTLDLGATDAAPRRVAALAEPD
ncbi:MAG: glycoside hydrolase family 95 protein, partial [Planctomycetota bacterium]